MSHLRYLCLLAYSGVLCWTPLYDVTHIVLWFFFGFFLFVLCTSMLLVSLDCSLIAPSVFSKTTNQQMINGLKIIAG
jgi:hypothetical protein